MYFMEKPNVKWMKWMKWMIARGVPKFGNLFTEASINLCKGAYDCVMYVMYVIYVMYVMYVMRVAYAVNYMYMCICT